MMIPLSGGRSATLMLPSDLTCEDVERISKILAVWPIGTDVSQESKNKIALATKKALRSRKANLETYSSTPYGYKDVDGELVPHRKEQRYLRQIFKMRKQGVSYGKIASRLNGSRVPSKTGGQWYSSTIFYITKNDLHQKLHG